MPAVRLRVMRRSVSTHGVCAASRAGVGAAIVAVTVLSTVLVGALLTVVLAVVAVPIRVTVAVLVTPVIAVTVAARPVLRAAPVPRFAGVTLRAVASTRANRAHAFRTRIGRGCVLWIVRARIAASTGAVASTDALVPGPV